MKKILMVLGMMLLVPFAVSAHGGDTGGGSETGEGMGMMESQLDHEEMEGLMKTFMTEGSLSSTDADSMIEHMNELMGAKIGGGMMGIGGSNGGHYNSMGMLRMTLFHGLVGVTSLVLLVAGIFYLSDRRKHIV